MTTKPRDIVTNLLDEFYIDYLSIEDGIYYYNSISHEGKTRTPIENLTNPQDYYPESFNKELNHLPENPDWIQVNNAVFLGNYRGKKHPGTGEYESAIDLGREAVTPYEIGLVSAIIATKEALAEFNK